MPAPQLRKRGGRPRASLFDASQRQELSMSAHTEAIMAYLPRNVVILALGSMLSLGVWDGMSERALAQEAASVSPALDGAANPATLEERSDQQRNELLRWLDEELYYHVLFRPADVDDLRIRIDEMSPTALDEYFRQTARLRELMQTQEWQIVNRFYGYYRSLDEVFTPEQREELARGPARLMPQDLMRLMNVLVDRYLKSQDAKQASQLQRQSSMATRANFLADQDRMRTYALQSAANRANRNYFAGYTPGSRVIRRDQYRVPGPLITSREMARLVVFRNLWYSF
jgi:hypothetical protein